MIRTSLLAENVVGFDRGRPVGALDDDLGLDLAGVVATDDVLNGGRHEDVDRQREDLVAVDEIRVREALEEAVLVDPFRHRVDVQPLRVVERTGDVRHSRDLDSHLMTGDGRIPAHVAEAVDRNRDIVGVDPPDPRRLGQEEHQPAAGRLPPGHAAAKGRRLPGDYRGDRVPDMLGVGVHEPGHHLLVGAEVGSGDVGLGPDHVDDLHREAPGHPLQLGAGELHRVDPNPTLCPAEGKADDRTFPGHQHGEGGDLAQIDVGGEPDPAFGRAHRGEVLDPITEEGLHLRVGVTAEREADHGRLLRDTKPVGDVVVQAHEAGYPVELAGGLLVHR